MQRISFTILASLLVATNLFGQEQPSAQQKGLQRVKERNQQIAQENRAITNDALRNQLHVDASVLPDAIIDQARTYYSSVNRAMLKDLTVEKIKEGAQKNAERTAKLLAKHEEIIEANNAYTNDQVHADLQVNAATLPDKIINSARVYFSRNRVNMQGKPLEDIQAAAQKNQEFNMKHQAKRKLREQAQELASQPVSKRPKKMEIQSLLNAE